MSEDKLQAQKIKEPLKSVHEGIFEIRLLRPVLDPDTFVIKKKIEILWSPDSKIEEDITSVQSHYDAICRGITKVLEINE